MHLKELRSYSFGRSGSNSDTNSGKIGSRYEYGLLKYLYKDALSQKRYLSPYLVSLRNDNLNQYTP
jgi:hypothetical protein